MELIFVSHQLKVLALTMRQQRGLSQREAAKASGISQPQIVKIENGYGSPSLATVEKLFTAYQYKVEFKVSDLRLLQREEVKAIRRAKKQEQSNQLTATL